METDRTFKTGDLAKMLGESPRDVTNWIHRLLGPHAGPGIDREFSRFEVLALMVALHPDMSSLTHEARKHIFDLVATFGVDPPGHVLTVMPHGDIKWTPMDELSKFLNPVNEFTMLIPTAWTLDLLANYEHEIS